MTNTRMGNVDDVVVAWYMQASYVYSYLFSCTRFVLCLNDSALVVLYWHNSNSSSSRILLLSCGCNISWRVFDVPIRHTVTIVDIVLYDVLTVCFEAPPHKFPYKHIPRLLCVMALANKTIQNEPHTLKMVIFVCTTVAVSLCDRANFTLILTRNGVENYSMTNDAIGGLWFSSIA